MQEKEKYHYLYIRPMFCLFPNSIFGNATEWKMFSSCMLVSTLCLPCFYLGVNRKTCVLQTMEQQALALVMAHLLDLHLPSKVPINNFDKMGMSRATSYPSQCPENTLYILHVRIQILPKILASVSCPSRWDMHPHGHHSYPLAGVF